MHGALHILDRFHIVAKMNKARMKSALTKRAGCATKGWTQS
jgi:hypothetical protein